MDSGDQGDRVKEAPREMDQEGHGLEGMTEDVGRLGVVGGLLVELFDSRHSFPLLGDLQPV